MKRILACSLLITACGYDAKLMTPPEESPTPTPSATPTPQPTPVVTVAVSVRPCILVEETTFDANTDINVWKPSYYYTPKADAGVTFDESGISLNGPRSGVTFFPPERNISNCPSMAFRVRGTIFYQSLGGAGFDNREAPVAVMIQYTDTKGVKHSSLTAFNEGEPDDRNTTRMFWWGFGYLEPTNSFGFSNFKPSVSPVQQAVPFDIKVDLFEKLGRTVKTINTITLEGSGWSLCSIISGFAMKPNEAFADPNAPYRLP